MADLVLNTAPVYSAYSKIFTFADGTSLHLWGPSQVTGRIVSATGSRVGSEIDFGDTSGSMLDFGAGLLPDGRVVIVTSANVTYDGGQLKSTLSVRIFDKAGTPLGEAVSLGDAARYNSRPSVVATKDGGFFVAWHDRAGASGTPTDLRTQALDSTGKTVGRGLVLGSGDIVISGTVGPESAG